MRPRARTMLKDVALVMVGFVWGVGVTLIVVVNP